MNVMVTGSRDWPADEWPKIYDVLDRLAAHAPEGMTLLHGEAAGPDSWADEWAAGTWETVEVKRFPPDYERYGASAPHVRNDEMLKLADIVIAFWDGKSRGTKSVIEKAKKRNLAFEVYSPSGVYVEV